MLELADVAAYLMERALLSPRAVVDGRLRVVDVSRLNRVFWVQVDGERSVVVKLAGEAGRAGVAREAAVLERLLSTDLARKLRSCLPTLVAYDAAQGVLILEASPMARDLRRHHAGGRFSCCLAREAGRALALLHSVPPGVLDGLPTSSSDPAWIMRVHRPDLAMVRTLSGAGIELIRSIQQCDELCVDLDALHASWRREAVIHGDIRWDNCVALRRGGSNRWSNLQLIDWELSGAGDPGFDIGGFFGEYLCAWVQSIPVVDPREPGRLLAQARLPLRRMRPALRSFWDAYTQHRGHSALELSRTLRRATRFAAARLLASALEEAQTLAELRERTLSPMRLSCEILRRPDEASAHLLGLGASWARQ